MAVYQIPFKTDRICS